METVLPEVRARELTLTSVALVDGFETNHLFDSEFFEWREVKGESFVLVSMQTHTRYGFVVVPGGIAAGYVRVVHCFTADRELGRDNWSLMTLFSNENGKVAVRPGWK